MPINFFENQCQENTNQQLFGLCDDPPPANNPAYINYDTHLKPGWIAEVQNNNSYEVTFTAIDNCIEIKRANGEDESKCEGFLTYNDSIIFVELKNRISKGWLAKARDQIKVTIGIFKLNHDVTIYSSKRAHVANAQRPFFQSGFQQVIDEIKNETGFIADVKTIIELK